MDHKNYLLQILNFRHENIQAQSVWMTCPSSIIHLAKGYELGVLLPSPSAVSFTTCNKTSYRKILCIII